MTKKGFTVVEIVVSFSLTAIIAVLLFNMIFGLKDLYINAVVKTELLNKQTVITQRINKELVSKKLANLYKCGTNCLIFSFEDDTYTRLTVDPVNKIITFGDFTTKLVKNSSFGNIDMQTVTTPGVVDGLADTYFKLKLPISYSLLSGDFGIEIIYQYDVDTTSISFFNNSNVNDNQILLLGNSPMTIIDGYIEPGYRLKFNDNEIYTNHPDVAITGTVGIDAGTYTLTYTYINEAGNTITANRTVINTPQNASFAYVGEEQSFYVPITGNYKLEVWGAQGAYGYGTTSIGGYGGYSTGVVSLTEGDVLYINVGGMGTTATQKVTGARSAGGYNGGGYGTSTTGKYGSGGGGATHIATSTGILSDLSSNISNVLIVAGGGGAGFVHGTATYNSLGGQGGGYQGTGLSPGTQTDGLFGQGVNNESNGSGGGGGFHGGLGIGSDNKSSGGGSGYIGNSLLLTTNALTKHMTCYKCDLSGIQDTYTLSTKNHSETAISDYAKSGNGYAKITFLGIPSEKDYVQQGLILHYDGIKNTSSIHSNTATTWKDISPTGNDGILTNFSYNATSGWTPNGLKFDGINDFVVTNSTKTDFSQFEADTNFSYCATFTTGATDINTKQGIVSNMTSLASGGFNMQYGTDDGIALGYGTYLKSNIASASNTTYNVCGVYNGRIMKIYVNGLLRNDSAYSIAAGNPTLQLSTLYNLGSSVELPTNGIIHNLLFYNRVLTNREIANNYVIDKIRFNY